MQWEHYVLLGLATVCSLSTQPQLRIHESHKNPLKFSITNISNEISFEDVNKTEITIEMSYV